MRSSFIIAASNLLVPPPHLQPDIEVEGQLEQYNLHIQKDLHSLIQSGNLETFFTKNSSIITLSIFIGIEIELTVDFLLRLHPEK